MFTKTIQNRALQQAGRRCLQTAAKATWSRSLTFASPETDFTTATFYQPHATAPILKDFYSTLPKTAVWSNTLSFASPESDFVSSHATPLPSPLPESLRDVLSSSYACVVTSVEKPHQIVHVNAAWVEMCGYAQQEAVNKTLSLIQGADTNTELADRMVERLVKDTSGSTWIDMYLVNYKKNGSPFKNHVSMRTIPLSEDQPDVKFLLGVLEEVDEVPLRMVAY